MATKESKKSVEALTHEAVRRKHIPTAEYQSVTWKEEVQPVRVAYERALAGGHRGFYTDPYINVGKMGK